VDTGDDEALPNPSAQRETPSVNFRLRAIDIKKKESEILYTQNTNLKVTAKN